MNQINHPLYTPLCDGLSALALDKAFSHPLLDYLDLLVRWNKAYNLTAIRDPKEMLTKHLLDSLAMHAYFTQENLADLGTGAGLPGIPLAIIRPEAQISLIESNGKKTRFLREVVRQLALPNVTVIESRAESVNQPGHFQAITARAMDRLAGILAVGGHLLSEKGVLLAMKGPQIDDEIAELPEQWQVNACHTLHVPGLLAERQLVIIGRKSPF
ncbi:MAG TPA: 16S rRNA (guanine(527)-N(7))-methyltransferase RsmG [Arenimonas sp.]|nr:16S rRNA (guanine(527)-N(7))-methyltransferase RsmG [Arenimonas sp.]